MIEKFANASALRLTFLISLVAFLPGVQSFAQSTASDQTPGAQQPSTPTTQTPAAQQPSSDQEPAEEESTSRRKKHEYKNWVFNIGAGANLDSGTTKNFVRGGGFTGMVGVARNANKYLGLRAEFIYADLPLKDSALVLASATGATSYAWAVTLNPIINIPVSSDWGGYIIFGGAFYHRAGSLDNSSAVPGEPCTAFWRWWGNCNAASVPISGDFTNTSLNQGGYNFGAGITRKTPSGVEIYAEYRLMHGAANGNTTDFRPVTIGFRW